MIMRPPNQAPQGWREGGLVFEAAQVEHECLLLDASDHWHWQLAQRGGDRGERPPCPPRGLGPDRKPRAGNRLDRQCARADLACAGGELDGERVTDGACHWLHHAVRQCLDFRLRPREQPQGRKALREAIRIAVKLERRLKNRNAHLVDAQRTLHRIPVDRLDQLPAADDEARLRATQQLVTRERHQIRALQRPLPRQSAHARGRSEQDRSMCRSRGH
jgi:hypothetical protein